MIRLREAQFSDSTAISKLHTESWRHDYRGILSKDFLDYKVEKNHSDMWKKRLRSPDKNQQTTVVTHDENIIGFSHLLLNDDHIFGTLLDNLHVSMDAQNKGIGKLLIQNCAKNISEKCYNKKMYLWVYELNKNAIRFYERLEGSKFETVEKEIDNKSIAQVSRYIWDNVTLLI